MQRSLRQIDSAVHWTHEITLGVVIRVISRARIEKVLSSLIVSELRKRKLTGVLRVVLCIAMDLFTGEAMDDGMDKWVAGARCLRPVDDFESAGASAICQRRQQLGVRPGDSLVSRSVSPVGKTRHTGCFLVRAAPDGDWQMNIGLSILLVGIESTFYSQDTIIPYNSFISGLQNSLERAQQVAALFKSAFAQFR